MSHSDQFLYMMSWRKEFVVVHLRNKKGCIPLHFGGHIICKQTFTKQGEYLHDEIHQFHSLSKCQIVLKFCFSSLKS